VRERGTQARRPRPGPPDRVRRADVPPDPTGSPRRRRPSDGVRVWQIVAIIAIIAATSGWTAAAMLAMREPPAAEVVTRTDDPAAAESDAPLPSITYSHSVPALEASLPTLVQGTTLVTMSWLGDSVIDDSGWGTTMTDFLKSKGKVATDMQVAQSVDPDQVLSLAGARIFRVDGISAADLLTATIAGTKVDSPTMTVSQLTLAGKSVTKGDGAAGEDSDYWYIQGDLLYEIQTNDEAVATDALAAIPAPGASRAPATSSSTSASPRPSPAASAAPTGSSAP
jgi:hypothetical protein